MNNQEKWQYLFPYIIGLENSGTAISLRPGNNDWRAMYYNKKSTAIVTPTQNHFRIISNNEKGKYPFWTLRDKDIYFRFAPSYTRRYEPHRQDALRKAEALRHGKKTTTAY